MPLLLAPIQIFIECLFCFLEIRIRSKMQESPKTKTIN